MHQKNDRLMLPSSRRLAALGLILLTGCLLGLGPAQQHAEAHPLGNYSINQYLLLNLRGETPEIYYLLDMAEIPSFPELDLIDTDFDSLVTDAEESSYLSMKVPLLLEKIRFVLEGRTVPLRLVDRRLSLQEGSGGMIVINVLIRLIPMVAHWPPDRLPVELEIVSENYLDNTGVRECKALLGSRFADETKPLGKKRLGYQTEIFMDRGGNPVYEDFDCQFLLRLGLGPSDTTGDEDTPLGFSWTRTARTSVDSGDNITWGKAFSDFRTLEDVVPGRSPVGQTKTPMAGETPESKALGQQDRSSTARDTMFDRVTDLIRAPSKELTPAIFMMGLAVALVLGMAHARSPGHGKTIMAAYLIGERGTAWNALVLGIVVTITHTWSVLGLGLVTLSAAEHVSEEKLSFWLGIGSGVIITIIGAILLVRRYRNYRVTHYDPLATHSHEHGHALAPRYGDTDHDHTQDGRALRDGDDRPPSYWHILSLGISGGIVPCPSALIVLLLAIKFGRLQYGIWLIVSFSLGLALVLIIIGLVVVYASGRLRKLMGEKNRLLKVLPIFSSAAIALLGIWVVIWTLLQYDVIVFRPGP